MEQHCDVQKDVCPEIHTSSMNGMASLFQSLHWTQLFASILYSRNMSTFRSANESKFCDHDSHTARKS